jgi:hypothetical protein
MPTMFSNLDIETTEAERWDMKKNIMLKSLGIDPEKPRCWADDAEEDEGTFDYKSLTVEVPSPSVVVPLTEVGDDWQTNKTRKSRSSHDDDMKTISSSTSSTSSTHSLGNVRHFNPHKNYGIVVPNSKMFNQEKFVFFNLPVGVVNGSRVRFWVEQTGKGAGYLAHIIEKV